LQDVAPAGDVVPAGHAKQAYMPVFAAYVPAAQGRHAAVPVFSA
jgi:hypothetical protein